jgi:hypothetical protein
MGKCMPSRWRWKVLGLAGLFLILAGCIIGDGGKGTVKGKITVGPLCPVEPCQDPPDVLSARSVVFERAGHDDVAVRLATDGRYSVDLEPGTYTLTLDECRWVGCAHVLPREVTVVEDETAIVDVDIDTGIR